MASVKIGKDREHEREEIGREEEGGKGKERKGKDVWVRFVTCGCKGWGGRR